MNQQDDDHTPRQEDEHKKDKDKKKHKKRHKEQHKEKDSHKEKKKHKKHKHKHSKHHHHDSEEAPPSSPPPSSSPPAPSPPQDSTSTSTSTWTDAKVRFPELTPDQWTKLEALGALVQDWNGKVNVISRKDIENVLPRHVLPCMGISKLLKDAKPGTKLMDVGTGGGFPGLPLAICCPNVHFLLVDSIGKKIKVVGDMAAKLGLQNVTARHTNVKEVKEKFHYITGRSVTAMPRFVGWVQDKFLTSNTSTSTSTSTSEGAKEMEIESGILYIKGGVSEENQEEDLGGWVPTERYKISELIGGGVYDGDKSVLHFSVADLQRGIKRKRP